MASKLIDEVRQRLQSKFGVEVPLEHPALEEHGDFATNIAMTILAKSKLQVPNSNNQINSRDELTSNFRNPREFAESLAAKIKPDDLIEKVEVAGPGFLNISIQTDAFIREVIRVLIEGDSYGKQNIGEGKKVVVDYSAPNIAKRFGIGHLRSTIIGQAIYNLYAFLGYKTIGDNHLGDWGTQFGVLLYKIQDPNSKIQNFDIDELEKLYVEFHQETKENPQLKNQARLWFKKLEDKDPVAVSIWKKCIEVSMTEFERIYKLLNVSIDYSYGESHYEEMMSIVLQEARAKNLTKISEGAEVMELPGFEVPLMLLKSDGATTYATRDLATIRFRKSEWDPAVIVYEVGNEQTLHFQQIFTAARMLGYVTENVLLVHTRHGLYLNPDGKKFSTRKGDTVKLEEVLNESILRAKSLGSASEEIAVQVGVGAIKYFDLSHNPQSDIVFDWDKVMALEGNSGPYLQYTYARISSVLEKSQIPISNLQTNSNLTNIKFSNEEVRVLRYVYRFPEAVEEAARRFSPNLLCNYLYELAGRYNAFYNVCPILKPENGRGEEWNSVKEFRLMLSAATGQVLKNGLKLLGIETPERM